MRNVAFNLSGVLCLSLMLSACQHDELDEVSSSSSQMRPASAQLASFTYTPISSKAATSVNTPSSALGVTSSVSPRVGPSSSDPEMKSLTIASIAKRASRETQSTPLQEGLVTGQISISDALKSSIPPSATLFVVARSSNTPRGMPLAVLRIPQLNAQSFPLTYKLTQANSMAGAPLKGSIIVSATLDQDANAFSKQPGDLLGAIKAPVQVGVNPVHLTLDQKR